MACSSARVEVANMPASESASTSANATPPKRRSACGARPLGIDEDGAKHREVRPSDRQVDEAQYQKHTDIALMTDMQLFDQWAAG